MTAAVAVMIRHERDAVAAFRAAGAVSPDQARAPESVGVRHDLALRRLQARAVLRPGPTPGTLYLDEPSWTALRGIRRRLALVVLAIVIFAGLALWFGSTRVPTP